MNCANLQISFLATFVQAKNIYYVKINILRPIFVKKINKITRRHEFCLKNCIRNSRAAALI
jgi:hypothetical protein